MSIHSQNQFTNPTIPPSSQSEQVVLKPLPISTPAKFANDKFAEVRRARFAHCENVALFLCELSGVEAYAYTLAGKFIVAAFTPRSKKPVFHYAYLDEAKRNERIFDFISAQVRHEMRKVEERAKRYSYELKLQVNDILYTSWGWEQTNVDFYQVIRVLKKKVIVRKIAKHYEETQYMAGHSTPIFGSFLSDEFMISAVGETSAKVEGQYARLLGFTEIEGNRVYEKKYESHYA